MKGDGATGRALTLLILFLSCAVLQAASAQGVARFLSGTCDSAGVWSTVHEVSTAAGLRNKAACANDEVGNTAHTINVNQDIQLDALSIGSPYYGGTAVMIESNKMAVINGTKAGSAYTQVRGERGKNDLVDAYKYRLFWIKTGATVTMENLDLRDGHSTDVSFCVHVFFPSLAKALPY